MSTSIQRLDSTVFKDELKQEIEATSSKADVTPETCEVHAVYCKYCEKNVIDIVGSKQFSAKAFAHGGPGVKTARDPSCYAIQDSKEKSVFRTDINTTAIYKPNPKYKEDSKKKEGPKEREEAAFLKRKWVVQSRSNLAKIQHEKDPAHLQAVKAYRDSHPCYFSFFCF